MRARWIRALEVAGSNPLTAMYIAVVVTAIFVYLILG